MIVAELVLGSALYQRTVWLWVLIALSYFPITELYTGKTLGKKKAGLIVVDEAGHLPNLSQVLKRTAARLLEVNPITGGGLIAAIAVLATEDHQRLGDLWAKTYVVQVAAANYHMFCAKSAWCMLVYVLRLKRRQKLRDFRGSQVR